MAGLRGHSIGEHRGQPCSPRHFDQHHRLGVLRSTRSDFLKAQRTCSLTSQTQPLLVMAPEVAEAAALGAAVRACPFLRNAAAARGEDYARRLAAGPLLLEDGLSGVAATLRLFHGPGGAVPLKRFGSSSSCSDPPATSTLAAGGCPFRAAIAAAAQAANAAVNVATEVPAGTPSKACSQIEAAPARSAVRPAARAPFASLSISGFGFVVSWQGWGCCVMTVPYIDGIAKA